MPTTTDDILVITVQAGMVTGVGLVSDGSLPMPVVVIDYDAGDITHDDPTVRAVPLPDARTAPAWVTIGLPDTHMAVPAVAEIAQFVEQEVSNAKATASSGGSGDTSTDQDD